MFQFQLLNILLLAFALWTGTSAEDLRSGLELEFGTWHPMALCPPGSFAHGFEVAAKDEVNKLFNDELAMTGMRLYCSHGANHSDTVISSYVMEGAGSWRGKSVCPADEWIIGFRLRLANYMGVTKDDTAANDANVICSSGLPLPGRGNVRGEWQHWSNCSEGSVVCGLATKADDARISLDKAGLVTVHLHCCPLNTNLNESDAMKLKSKENVLHSVPETSTNKGDTKQNEMSDPNNALRTDILHEEMLHNETLEHKHADGLKTNDVHNHADDPQAQDKKHAETPKPEEFTKVPFGNSESHPSLSGNTGSQDTNIKQELKPEPKPDENSISKNPIKFPA